MTVSERKVLKVTAERKDLAGMRAFVENAAAGEFVDKEALADMLLAVNEDLTNIILYGYHDRPGNIEIEVGYERDSLVVVIRDWAAPFDPSSVPPPDLSIPLELRPLGGMGVHMMRNFTDEMVYRPGPNGSNELVLVKKGVRTGS